MKINFENFLTKPLEEKVRNPFFLALIVSIFHYNKKFIFTVFLPAEDWQQRWMYLGEYWIKAGFWDYVVVVLWAIGFTIAFYAAAYVTYVIAMIYDKRLRPWVGNLIYKKGFVERLQHEKLKSAHEQLNKLQDDLTKVARNDKSQVKQLTKQLEDGREGIDYLFEELHSAIEMLEMELRESYNGKVNKSRALVTAIEDRNDNMYIELTMDIIKEPLKNLRTKVMNLASEKDTNFSTYRRMKQED